MFANFVQAQFFHHLAFWTAEMAHDDNFCAVIDQILYGWQRSAHTRIVGDGTSCLVSRNVEIYTDQCAFAADIDVLNGFLTHDGPPVIQNYMLIIAHEAS